MAGRTIKRLPAERGLPPLDVPVAGLAIEELLAEERERRDTDHALNRSAEPAKLIASDAYACRRKIAFGRIGYPKDITYDAAALMTFRAGDFYHEVTKKALIQFFDADTEVDFDLRPRHSVYGKADATASPDGGAPAVVEIKSQAGYGFDLAVGARRSGEGPGPKIDHLMQAGMGAMALGLARVWVIYINKDRGVVAEWIVGLDDPLPHLSLAGDLDLVELLSRGLVEDETIDPPSVRQLVEWEIACLKRDVIAVMDRGDLPARLVPGFGLVTGTPPERDTKGDPWNCRYCSWQPTCAALDHDAVPGWVDAFLAAKEQAS